MWFLMYLQLQSISRESRHVEGEPCLCGLMVYCEKQWCTLQCERMLRCFGRREKRQKPWAGDRRSLPLQKFAVSFTLSLYIYLFKNVYVCMYKHATYMQALCGSPCVCKPEVEPEHLTSIFSALLSGNRVSYWTWILLIQIDCLAINSQRSFYLCLPRTGIKAAYHWILASPSHKLGYWKEWKEHRHTLLLTSMSAKMWGESVAVDSLHAFPGMVDDTLWDCEPK